MSWMEMVNVLFACLNSKLPEGRDCIWLNVLTPYLVQHCGYKYLLKAKKPKSLNSQQWQFVFSKSNHYNTCQLTCSSSMWLGTPIGEAMSVFSSLESGWGCDCGWSEATWVLRPGRKRWVQLLPNSYSSMFTLWSQPPSCKVAWVAHWKAHVEKN